MNRMYEKTLLDNALKFDKAAHGNGRIVKCAATIVENQSQDAVAELCRIISRTVDVPNQSRQALRMAVELKESLIKFFGYLEVSKMCSQSCRADEDNRTLQELLDELHELVGLKNVKEKVNDLIAYQNVQKMRREQGLYSEKSTLHLAFTGNPGTGKTTAARIIGRIYKQLGMLSKGHFTEVSRTDLIAGYQGQTALKVKDVIEKAKGGVLFIDEAYSITENDHSDSYGRECLTELTKALEDYRDNLVVIVAGYTEPMKSFFESNPGLKSRFHAFLEFDDYNESELYEIIAAMCRKNSYELSSGAAGKIKQVLAEKIADEDGQPANGRLARNLYDDFTMNHARRVVNIENPNRQDLVEIREADIRISTG